MVLPALFTSVRARLMAILGAAAIPLFVMAASIAVQNFRSVMDRTAHQMDLLRVAARARHDFETEQMARILSGLADLLSANAPESVCADVLRTALAVAPQRLLELVLVGADGTPTCATAATAGPLAQAGGLVRRARASVVPVDQLEPIVAGDALPTLSAALALSPGDQHSPVLVARVTVDWLAARAIGAAVPGTAAWLIDPGGGLAPLEPESDATRALPPAADVSTLLARQGDGRVELSRAGEPYAYSTAVLGADMRVLLAVPASKELLRADAVLAQRLAALGLLLFVGLLAMAVGAHAAVVRPVKNLSRAVQVWRNGGVFDPEPGHGAPREIAELARTFGEAAAALRGREAELRALATRQDLLMQEVHHRVKNNLQIVASLLNLQASRIRLPQARAEFQSARDRIRALATLHRHLYAHGDLHTINMREFLVELCSQLLQAMGIPEGGRIALDIEAAELELSSDQAIPLSLIVTEAVSNAAKYAFPDGRAGHIRVNVVLLPSAGPDAAPAVRLVIQDDGVGIPAGRAETESGVRDGIGLHLIRGFARQLGATLDVGYDNGTRYELKLVLKHGHAAPATFETEPDPVTA